VTRALKKLEKEGFLTTITLDDLGLQLRNVKKLEFHANAEAYRQQPQLILRRARRVARLVDEYSDPENAKRLGVHLETLVRQELRAQGFNIVGTHTAEYRGRRWTATNHTLDIVAEHTSGALPLGVEVKNALDIMSQRDRCEDRDVRPPRPHPGFAVRWIKPYIECVNRQGGFCWVFKTQIYPPGKYEEVLTKKLYRTLSAGWVSAGGKKKRRLEFPVTTRGDLPPKSVEKFAQWVGRATRNPPKVKPAKLCSKGGAQLYNPERSY